ncbi:hypothetical protein DOG16_08845, partial [Salmonella enterica]|nr:hypothetical protein [Salmonella enterica]
IYSYNTIAEYFFRSWKYGVEIYIKMAQKHHHRCNSSQHLNRIYFVVKFHKIKSQIKKLMQVYIG